MLICGLLSMPDSRAPSPFITYALGNIRQPVGHGATAPEIGDVTAIIKQDGSESRSQIYSEYVAGRLAALVGVPVADGVFVAHSRGLRYASLKIAEVGFSLVDIEHEHASEVASRYPVEVAKLAVFDAWICNADRAGNLRANIAESTDNLMVGLDHGGSLLSVADTINTALERLNTIDWPPAHMFKGMLSRHLVEPVVARIKGIMDDAIDDACVLSGTVGSVMLPDQAMLAEAIKWRRNSLVEIVERCLFPAG